MTVPPIAGHPLDELLGRWSVPSDRLRPDPRLANRFMAWLPGCEPKIAMRLAWSLGIERDMEALERFWCPDGGHAEPILAALGDDISRVPRSVWLAFLHDGLKRRVGTTFAPLSDTVAPDDRLLVHFTWNPAALFAEGFRGTADHDSLTSTFMVPKHEDGFNFAFEAEGFDAGNHGADDFYGDDAVIFRAPHLTTANMESFDEEVIVWGPDIDVGRMVHLRRDDGAWNVIDNQGNVAYAGGTVEGCVDWVKANEHGLGSVLFGPRSYEMRSVDFDEEAALAM